ncbi:hypothetical protein KVF89_21460 [Nocardioides carbamazepini]|uniref:hypothetical protein n=1 Tax=Nocardioides carbamazepini TaxID=2854259 RepID=UPI002149A6C7|nr:hypothetical protein [Nocardioides carbamazepini]MCR1785121.1 hypothetical protein [Nocardioides carbamazepini]
MTASGAPFAPPPPPGQGPPSPFAQPARPLRESMVLRHVVGVVVALGLTPVGILVFDYGAGRYARERMVTLEDSGATGELVLMFVGALILAAVAASARVSGLGPVVAGLLWGGVPFVWFLADLPSFFDFAQDLPSNHYWFAVPTYLFPLVAALLVGSGLAGRWRARS